MINRLIEFSLKNRGLILLAYALLAVWGYWALLRTPIDAIPDLSENQVIVYTDWAGRSPQEVEDQITYPLTVNLQGLAGVRDVRSSSALGFSMINIIFQDKIDPYFARTRVLERLNLASGFLPEGVVPVLGPDATGVGQVFWYTVEGPYDGGTLHSLQDWFIKYQLNSVSGVAEVASIGGWVRQYQIDVDPIKLRAYNIPLRTVIEGVQRSNTNVGAKVIEASDQEMAVRGIGLIRSTADLENIVLTATAGTPVYIRNVANVHLGPEFRRGVLDKDGKDVVGGVVVIRNGANAQEVISGVKAKLTALEPGLPKGVHIIPFYDRSTLILHAVNTLKSALLEEILLVTLAHVIFLWHFRSILIVTIPLPLAVLGSFLFMHYADISSNIMSLGGIAIAIGVLVDAGIVMTENVLRHAERYYEEHGEYQSAISQITLEAASQVGRPANLLCDDHHHSGFCTSVCTHRHGRQDVSPAGVHQDFRHGVFNVHRGHFGAGALHLLDPWKTSARGRQSRDARSGSDLQTGTRLGLKAQDHDAECGSRNLWLRTLACNYDRLRVHAAAR